MPPHYSTNQKLLAKVRIYRKIPISRPGLIFVKKGCFAGLIISEELIFGVGGGEGKGLLLKGILCFKMGWACQ